MKRVLALAFASMLLLASCSQSGENDMQYSNASFTVTLSDAGTRASIDNDGEGAAVTRFVVAAYTQGKVWRYQTKTVTAGTHNVTFDIPLVDAQTYDFLFWADAGESYYDATSLRDVRMVTPQAGNCDARDAFFASIRDHVANGAYTETVTLRRPFAQINIITEDLQDVYEAEDQSLVDMLKPENITVAYTTQFYTEFDVLSGTGVGAPVAITYTAPVYGCATPSAQGNTLSMDYLFAGTEQGTLDFASVTVTHKGGATPTTLCALTNIPYKRNCRTNIRGSFLTHRGSFNVVVDETWNTPEIEIDK